MTNLQISNVVPIVVMGKLRPREMNHVPKGALLHCRASNAGSEAHGYSLLTAKTTNEPLGTPAGTAFAAGPCFSAFL